MSGGLHTSSCSKFHLSESFPLRIITHNIRVSPKTFFKYERIWPERLPNIMRQFHHYTALPFNPASTIICLQEAKHEQLGDILKHLCKVGKSGNWAYVGVGRDDGILAGEFNPILYRPETWDKLHSETIWLSETPSEPSKGWDAGWNRLCTCLVLRTKHEHPVRTIMLLNTHLDVAGVVARRKSAALILNYTREWKEAFQPDHILLASDLNSTKDEADGAWQILNAEGSGFVDIKRALDDDDIRRFGDDLTYTGFDGCGNGEQVSVIDFVHYGLKDGEDLAAVNERLHSFTTVPNLFDDGIRCSDHRALVVDLLL